MPHTQEKFLNTKVTHTHMNERVQTNPEPYKSFLGATSISVKGYLPITCSKVSELCMIIFWFHSTTVYCNFISSISVILITQRVFLQQIKVNELFWKWFDMTFLFIHLYLPPSTSNLSLSNCTIEGSRYHGIGKDGHTPLKHTAKQKPFQSTSMTLPPPLCFP